jgi:hypothetical protein
MKKLLLIFVAIAMISCEPNGDALVRILENGIEQVNSAKSHQELSNITIEVKAKMMRHASLPGGNRKMSAANTRKVLDAQNRFYRAVERKAEQLK